jgi:hypothetical protein
MEGENRSLKTAAVRPPFSSGFPHFFLKFFLFTRIPFDTAVRSPDNHPYLTQEIELRDAGKWQPFRVVKCWQHRLRLLRPCQRAELSSVGEHPPLSVCTPQHERL